MSDIPTPQDRLDWTILDNAKKAIQIADLEKQLAERDAALARCVEAVKDAYASGYGKAHNDTVEGFYSPEQSADDYMDEVATSLPASAQATAKVLAAARLHYERSNCTDHGPGGIVKQCRCLVCEAIREEKETK